MVDEIVVIKDRLATIEGMPKIVHEQAIINAIFHEKIHELGRKIKDLEENLVREQAREGPAHATKNPPPCSPATQAIMNHTPCSAKVARAIKFKMKSVKRNNPRLWIRDHKRYTQ